MYIVVYVCFYKIGLFFIVFDIVFLVVKILKFFIEWNKYLCLIGKEFVNVFDGILEL